MDKRQIQKIKLHDTFLLLDIGVLDLNKCIIKAKRLATHITSHVMNIDFDNVEYY